MFGESNIVTTTKDLEEVLKTSHMKAETFYQTKIDDIIAVLDQVGRLWKRDSTYWKRAFEIAKRELSFSEAMIAESLNVIPEICCARNVRARLMSDFSDLKKLDCFAVSRTFLGRERVMPLGVLYHVSAGNVFLGAVDSLIMGFLTKNISIVKLSSKNVSFPVLFSESLVEADERGVLSRSFALLDFRRGESQFETLLKSRVHGIIAWGGEEMILNYKKDLPLGVRFIEYGPKISFQVVNNQAVQTFGFRDIAKSVARDVCMWDQAACASPQNLFIEYGVDKQCLMKELELAFSEFALPRGRLNDDEYVEVAKERARGQYDRVMNGGLVSEGADWLIHYDSKPGLRPSPLNRTLIVKDFRSLDDLIDQVSPFKRYLQSCGYLCVLSDDEIEHFLTRLAGVGVMRFARLGHVMEAPIGAPHDGRMTLVELTKLVPEEQDHTPLGLINDAILHVSYYRKAKDSKPVASLDEMPLSMGKDFEVTNMNQLGEFCHEKRSGGYVFSSGGTTGAPKFTCYSHDEFDRVASMLAVGFKAQGIHERSVVANMFVAGNMWSSFIAVDHALAKIGATVLPIGGLADKDLALDYLAKFRPDAVIGLPTQIVELATHSANKGVTIQIPQVFYAGEHLSLVARSHINRIFHTEYFGSAGYASVDAGPIGYQCKYLDHGVHHLFDHDVHMEIIDGEGVVTSLVKRYMPVIRLRTGDLISWSDADTPCRCGSMAPTFLLRGRANSQINVWGCRVFVEEFERSLLDVGVRFGLMQIVVSQIDNGQDLVTVKLEGHAADVEADQLRDRFFEICKDLKATHSRAWLNERLCFEAVSEGQIERVARTGKVRSVLDLR